MGSAIEVSRPSLPGLSPVALGRLKGVPAAQRDRGEGSQCHQRQRRPRQCSRAYLAAVRADGTGAPHVSPSR
ncbi:hypothetical protein ACFWBB_04010 [Streptomyces sp. NPDC060000]|uniref:hypothetical protein n=1 Tax=Streptomyces sp. NPDC060000 TaxID=3347031 RepID=UPI0036B75ED0